MLSMKEFVVAMELLNTRRLSDRKISNVYVPVFQINNTTFIYSINKHVVLTDSTKNLPMKLAMKRVGKEHINTICSIEELFIIALTLNGTYSSERVDSLLKSFHIRLFKDTYNELMVSPWVLRKDITAVLQKRYPPFLQCSKMRKLYDVVATYDNVVNPFVRNLTLREPVSDFIDVIRISKDEDSFSFAYKNSETSFTNNADGWKYCTQLNDYETIISHCYMSPENKTEKEDEFIHFVSGKKEVLISFQSPMNFNNLSSYSDRHNIITEKHVDFLIQKITQCITELKSYLISTMFVTK